MERRLQRIGQCCIKDLRFRDPTLHHSKETLSGRNTWVTQEFAFFQVHERCVQWNRYMLHETAIKPVKVNPFVIKSQQQFACNQCNYFDAQGSSMLPAKTVCSQLLVFTGHILVGITGSGSCATITATCITTCLTGSQDKCCSRQSQIHLGCIRIATRWWLNVCATSDNRLEIG